MNAQLKICGKTSKLIFIQWVWAISQRQKGNMISFKKAYESRIFLSIRNEVPINSLTYLGYFIETG